MTSVPNHRRPLNGSKYIAILLCITLCSCNIIRSNPVASNPSVEKVPSTTPEQGKEKAKKVDIEKEELQEINFHGQSFLVPRKKKEFKLALILPFHLGFKTKNQKRIAAIMMDYYKGLRFSLDELKELGFRVSLTVYDNKNDSMQLKRILQKKEIYKMDLVIGPIQKDQMRIISRILKPYKIPIFSPFTSLGQMKDVNSYFYSFVGGQELRAKQFVAYLEKYHKNDKLVILRDGKSFDRSFVPHLIKELDKHGKIKYVKEAYKSQNNWSALLEKKKNTVVLIASKQQNIVQTSLGGLIAAKEEVTVFGDNSWVNFNDNDFMFWENLNMHILANDFSDPNDSMLMETRLRFRESYSEDPSTYSLRAYDQMTFIGDLLMAFGEHFPKFVDHQSFQYQTTSFQFVPYHGCRQNKNLIILKYNNHKLEEVD
jgi:ABC-type branched-subunit amino acid transport system substrate-binding protein